MRWTDERDKWRTWLVDYSAARTRAIEWLGDRYLLARPINRRGGSGPHEAGGRLRGPAVCIQRAPGERFGP